MADRTSLRQALKGVGQRVTPQRVFLLELLRRGGNHLDADELYRQAKRKYPRLSLSTVYRSLGLFKRLGLVEELHFEEEHHHYEGKAAKEHHHLLCLRCGKVTEFESPHIPALKKELATTFGFAISGAEIHLSGLCLTCRKG